MGSDGTLKSCLFQVKEPSRAHEIDDPIGKALPIGSAGLLQNCRSNPAAQRAQETADPVERALPVGTAGTLLSYPGGSEVFLAVRTIAREPFTTCSFPLLPHSAEPTNLFSHVSDHLPASKLG